MIPFAIQEFIQNEIQLLLDIPAGSMDMLPAGGGSINLAYELVLNEQYRFFCKINSASRYPAMFEKEKHGLHALASVNTIAVPSVIFSAVRDDFQILVLEWIESAEPEPAGWKRLGEQLAALHYCSAAAFGFSEDNYMGALPQSNQFSSNWPRFFMVHRLMPMVQRAFEAGLLQSNLLSHFERLYKALPGIFPPEIPSLLHGDLWSGNFMFNQQQQPVLLDPAVYYGCRSMDLGMTGLFGGFDSLFYDAYHYHHPLPANHKEQWEVCNLYPLLIHLILFGKAYLADIERTIRRF